MTSLNPPPPPPIAIPLALPVSRPPFPTIGQAVLLTLLLIGAQLVCGTVLGVTGLLLDLPLKVVMGPGSIILANLASFVVVFAVAVYWGKLPIRLALPLRPMSISLVPPLAITVVGLSVLLSELCNLVWLLLPPSDFGDLLLGGLLGDQQQMWQSVVLLCIVAPLTEEPIFRGVMLNGLLQRRRPWTAVLVTALLFAVIHLNPWQFFPALALGLLFGWWFMRTRSLWPCVLGHALNNSLPHIALAIPRLEIRGYTPTASEEVLFQPLWFNLVGLILLTAGLAWTWREFRRLPGPPIDR